MTTIKSIRDFLQRRFGHRYKRPTIYYALRVRLGYRYSKPVARFVEMTPKRRRRLRKHWLQRDLALKMQARGEAIIVYWDLHLMDPLTFYDPGEISGFLE